MGTEKSAISLDCKGCSSLSRMNDVGAIWTPGIFVLKSEKQLLNESSPSYVTPHARPEAQPLLDLYELL